MATNAAFQPGQSSAEPSMEEILASIRKIIADDSLGTKKDEPYTPEPVPVMVEPDETDSDVLDLAEVATVAEPSDDMLIGAGEQAPEMSFDDLPGLPEPVMVDVDVMPEPEPVPVMITPPPVAAPAPRPTAPVAMGTEILSSETSGLVAGAFAQLSRNAAMPAAGRTIEDVMVEMLRPMLRDWMDSHLPGIVERLVKAEIERVSRG
jgi:cell pole-organizing protein PopZ